MIDLSLNQVFSIKSLIIYILAINVITFLAMGLDKWKAKRGAWRISEGALLGLVLLGGGVGGIVGMFVFHHKTKKAKFNIGFPAILIVETIVLVYFLVTR